MAVKAIDVSTIAVIMPGSSFLASFTFLINPPVRLIKESPESYRGN